MFLRSIDFIAAIKNIARISWDIVPVGIDPVPRDRLSRPAAFGHRSGQDQIVDGDDALALARGRRINEISFILETWAHPPAKAGVYASAARAGGSGYSIAFA